MQKPLVAAAIAVLAISTVGVDVAQAAHRHRVVRQRAEYRDTRRCVRHKANNGTVIGAVAGGVLGNAIGGHGVGGTLIGAGAGAVAGHEIGKSHGRSSC